ncbi:MAG: cytochrome P450 [Coleofasciculus sp. G1-WW12-02]|uniref:cytochrome P450 n=1 Tax=Coleofasciculus sp. G1-WW12-02 TaxID=3068483 RepID=UPI0032F11AC5
MKLPDDPKLPFFVQTLQLIAQPLKFLDTCTQRYGDTFTLRLLGTNSPPVVFFSHPQAIQSIFTTESDKFEWVDNPPVENAGDSSFIQSPSRLTRSRIGSPAHLFAFGTTCHKFPSRSY